MSFQFYRNLGNKLTRASLSYPKLTSFHDTLLTKSPRCIGANQQIVYISTSKKNRETITSDVTVAKVQTPTNIETNTEPPKKKYWRSTGFSLASEEHDVTKKNGVYFWMVTIMLCGTTFILAYMPDMHYRDWAQREAYIELARREALGLPLVDPDLIPAEDVHLPTDEELGDFEIII